MLRPTSPSPRPHAGAVSGRRDFLFRVLGTGLAVVPLVRAAGRAPALQLGYSLYGMKTLPLERALAECRRIGYRAVELALMPGYPTDPAKLTPAASADLRRQLASAGLPVASLIVNLTLVCDEAAHAANLQLLETAARFAREIDAARPPIIQTVMGGKPGTWETVKASMLARLRDWDAAARRHGVTVAVKAHALHAADTVERLLWIFHEARGTNLALAYDHSHFELAGQSPEQSYRAFHPPPRFIHIKDARREDGQVRFLLPGEGRTDYPAYFRMLEKSGYDGPLVVEVSAQIFNRPGYDPIATAERCFAALAPALRG